MLKFNLKDKKKTKTFLTCALVFGVGILFAASGIRAYLTSTDTVTNTFTVGEVTIDTLEPNYPGNGSDEVTDMVPREEVKKDPQIKNTGKNRAMAYIRVDLPIANVITTDVDGNRLPKENRELFDYRTTDGEFNSTHDEWILIDTTYFNGDNEVPAIGDADKVSRLYGYYQVIEEGYTTVPIFDVVRLINVIEGQIDNTVQDIKITSYAIQADNIEGLTEDFTTGTFTEEDLAKVWDVYFKQSGNVDPADADTTGNQTVKNSTLNVTMIVKNTHLKLNTGNAADTMTTTDYTVAYTGSGTKPTAAFASTNPEVATVDQEGNITAVGVGETTIVMTAKNPDNGKTASASVTVTVRDMNAGAADDPVEDENKPGESTGTDDPANTDTNTSNENTDTNTGDQTGNQTGDQGGAGETVETPDTNEAEGNGQ